MNRLKTLIAKRWQRFKCPADVRPRLGLWRAVWRSFFGCPTDFYPRVKVSGGAVETLDTDAILGELGKTTKSWTGITTTATIGQDPPAGAVSLNDAIDLARQSLDEVKAQTEYQDQKAGRLLTVSTILSAIAGLLFQRFNDAYPVQGTLAEFRWSGLLVAAAYLMFAAFVFAVLCGALVTFHATRTRFKYEATEKPSADRGNPKSRLFYNPILGVRPRVWAGSFVASDPGGEKESLIVNPALQRLYFADLVGETYLIAAKTADKIRYLEEAQRLFAWALRCLLFWLVLLAAVSIFVRSTEPEASATKVQIEKMPLAASPRLVRIDPSQPLKVDARVISPPNAQTSQTGAGKGQQR